MALPMGTGNRGTSSVIQLIIGCIVIHRLWRLGFIDLNVLFPFLHPTPSICGFVNVTEYGIMSDRVVLPNGVVPAVVIVKDERIKEIIEKSQRTEDELSKKYEGLRVLDYGNAVVSSGLIDVHTHMNEPGRWDWEGMLTGTKSAAAGGITTVVDMPLNSWPATTTAKALRDKKNAAKIKAHVDVAFWGGLVPENAFQPEVLQSLLDEGALGFKAFMHPSAINDFPHINRSHLEAGIKFAKAKGVPVLLHAELAEFGVVPESDPTLYSTYLASRPRAMEVAAVRMVLDVLRQDNSTPWEPGFSSFIAHLSDADLITELQAAKAQGLPIKVETCAHYLTFVAEDIAPKDTQFKCSPPIREKENRERLWQGLKDGVIDLVSSDHSPSPPYMKRLEEGDFMTAWGGISGLQYCLAATWNGMVDRGLDLQLISNWWSWQPALLAGLHHRKGVLAPNYDADIVVWDPEADARTSEGFLFHRHKLTPYANMKLKGHVIATFVGGHQVFKFEGDESFIAKQRCGKPVLLQNVHPVVVPEEKQREVEVKVAAKEVPPVEAAAIVVETAVGDKEEL